MSVTLSNPTSALSGKEVILTTGTHTITGPFTFDRDPSAPFAVTSGSAVVANLDADKVDGIEGTALLPKAGGTITGALTVNGAQTNTTTLDVQGTVTLSTLLNVSGVVTLGNADSTVKAGASTETMKLGGVIDVDSTQQGTGANTSDTVLRTYTLPANAFNANGRVLKITAWGSFGANANAKTVRIKWNGLAGTTVVANTLSVNNQNWIAIGHIVRTGSNTQDTFGYTLISSPSQDLVATFGTAAVTDTGTIDIVISGQNGSAVANDIRYEGSIIEFLN